MYGVFDNELKHSSINLYLTELDKEFILEKYGDNIYSYIDKSHTHGLVYNFPVEHPDYLNALNAFRDIMKRHKIMKEQGAQNGASSEINHVTTGMNG